MNLPDVVPMLGDAGAHVGFFTDTDSPTVLLSELTRKHGVYTLPDAVHRITGKSAQIIGLKDVLIKSAVFLKILHLRSGNKLKHSR